MMMINTGKATPQGTQSYADRFPEITFNTLGDTDIVISQAGFGGYRINNDNEIYHLALTKALLKSINLIDTSANYADTGSEALVGRVVGDLIEKGRIKRESVFVISKAGYLQGENYLLAMQRKKDGRPYPNLVKYAQGLDHCIHPEFLEDQLTGSLGRLKMDCLDGYLLHNPEYYLSWAHRAGMPLIGARQEFYHRVRMAFEHLEKEVENGRIQWYGISSNTFPNNAHDPKFISLTKVWELANDLDARHFKLVQLPMNLIETGAVTENNQPGGQSVLDFAREKGLTILVNRPLNAIYSGSLVRLADVHPPAYPFQPNEVTALISNCLQLEEDFHTNYRPHLDADEATSQLVQEYLSVGLMLEGKWGDFRTYQNWQDVQAQFLLPRVQNAIQFLSNQSKQPLSLNDWINRYINTVNDVLTAVSAYYQEKAVAKVKQIKGMVLLAEPDWQADTLSQIAVRALRSTAGISSVLVGMRRPPYVEDVVAELVRPVEVKEREESWNNLKNEFQI